MPDNTMNCPWPSCLHSKTCGKDDELPLCRVRCNIKERLEKVSREEFKQYGRRI